MRDIMVGIFLFAGAYVCSTGFAIILFRIFFPLKAKTPEVSRMTVASGGNRWRSSTSPRVQMLDVGKDFVKASS